MLPVLLLQHKIVIALRAVSGKFFANHSFDGEWRKDSRSSFGPLALMAFAPKKGKKLILCLLFRRAGCLHGVALGAASSKVAKCKLVIQDTSTEANIKLVIQGTGTEANIK